jgi:hypothetical protein
MSRSFLIGVVTVTITNAATHELAAVSQGEQR